MSDPVIYDFPSDWYGLVVAPQKYRIRSESRLAKRAWVGARSVAGPYAQYWLADVTLAPQVDPVRQDIQAWFERLRGQAGAFRFADVTQLAPWYDRSITTATSTFSDGTLFTDGTGFVDDLLPPFVRVATAAPAGSRYLVLAGLPHGTAAALRQGDRLQVYQPNGIAGTVPHLYRAMLGGTADTNGKLGIPIEPPLRAGVAANDPVGLRNTSTIFRMLDDQQAEMQIDSGGVGSISFSAIEALDLIP